MFASLPSSITRKRLLGWTIHNTCKVGYGTVVLPRIQCQASEYDHWNNSPTTTHCVPNVTAITRRLESSAIFTGWTPLEWHKETFLSGASVQEKEAWLHTMLRRGDATIDIEAFLVVLNALADSSDADAPRRAEQWMKRLKDHPHVRPTAAAYEAVIRSWANSQTEQPLVVVNRAERWFNEIVEKSEQAHHRHIHHDDSDEQILQPTIELYNAYLDACTRGRCGNNKRNQFLVEKNASKADALLRRLLSDYHHKGGVSLHVVPNTDTFNYVMRGWTRCRPSEILLKRTFGLLRLMESYQRENPLQSAIRPNTKSYCLVMDMLVRHAKFKAMTAHQSGRSEDPKRNGTSELEEAEAILKYMHELYDAGVEGVVPHCIPYNLLITGWAGLAEAKHANAPFRAEEILRRMFAHQDNGFVEAAPDRVSYEKVMLAWAASSHQNAGLRAQWWLKKLWNDSELRGDKNLLPTVKTYNIVIRALAKTEGALAAENLLLDLGDLYREDKASSFCPNSESFGLVIRAWLETVQDEENIEECLSALDRAVQWLCSFQEIEDDNNLSIPPELYHKVFMAAKKCAKDRPEVLDMVKPIFENQKKSRRGVDGLSYAYFLQVGLVALSSPDCNEARTDFIDGLFKRCCDDGLLGRHFVRALATTEVGAEGWTESERREMIHRHFQRWPFPASWTRNIRNELHFARMSDFDRYTRSLQKRLSMASKMEEGTDDDLST